MQASGSDCTLYEWISASDPNHSMQELLEQVQEQLHLVSHSDVESTRRSPLLHALSSI